MIHEMIEYYNLTETDLQKIKDKWTRASRDGKPSIVVTMENGTSFIWDFGTSDNFFVHDLRATTPYRIFPITPGSRYDLVDWMVENDTAEFERLIEPDVEKLCAEIAKRMGESAVMANAHRSMKGKDRLRNYWNEKEKWVSHKRDIIWLMTVLKNVYTGFYIGTEFVDHEIAQLTT